MDVTRHFIRVGDREVHYRRAGKGPPLVLFHVSPQTSAFVIRELLRLAEHHTLIALDTPGYGESDPLPATAPTMADYADAMSATLKVLGIQRAAVYGSHTGANIAVELARRSPGQVAGLVLDGLSLNTPAVAADRVRHYAPQFVPSAGGEHLAWAWQHTRDQVLFWPWYRPHRANRLATPMASANYLHEVVLAKMAAADYWLGYRAAFSHDARDALRELTVKTWFVTAASDAHTQIERSIQGLPANIHFVDTTHESQLGAIAEVLSRIKADDSTPGAPATCPRRSLYRSYVDRANGQRLVRQGGRDSGRPLLMLHGGMATSALVTDAARALAAHRPVLAMDIAGNGDSDPLTSGECSLEAYAGDVRASAASLGITEFDLYGEATGATLAIEIARQAPDAVGRIILDRPEIPDHRLRAELLQQLAPPIEARWDGSHFLTAWHMLRDAAMFWPWYERSARGVRDVEPQLEPVALQRRLLTWLKGRLTYSDYIHAALRADTDSLLGTVRHPTLVIGTPGDILYSHAQQAARQLSAGQLYGAEEQRAPISALNEFLRG